MTDAHELHLQFMLVDFRAAASNVQRDFIVAALDECCGLAKEGQMDRRTAGQILFRAQLIASFLESLEQPKLKVIHGKAV